jgi:hypothetical protein
MCWIGKKETVSAVKARRNAASSPDGGHDFGSADSDVVQQAVWQCRQFPDRGLLGSPYDEALDCGA